MNRFQVRRATVEDLPQLRPLWEVENLRVEDLEKRFTEFQVACTDQGEMVAAIGLQISAQQGCLHSEAIGWPDVADEIRSQLWPRLQALARNQRLGRLWTALAAPFWKSVGFKKAAEEGLAQLPAPFAEEAATWLFLPLRAGEGGTAEIEKQFAVLRAMSQAENERLLDRAKLMKWIAMGLMLVVFGTFAVWVVYWAQLRRRLKKRQTREL